MILDKLKSIGKKKTVTPIVEVDDQQKKLDIVSEAQKTVYIVVDGLKSGDFETMNENLGALSSTKVSREKLVFEKHSTTPYIVIATAFVAVSICFLYFIYIGIGTAVFSEEYRNRAYALIAFTLIILLTNAIVIRLSISTIRFINRYDKYYKNLKFRNIEIVDDLATYAQVPVAQTVKDLKRAIKWKLIPQGHFGRDNMFIILSDEIYDIYSHKKAAFDRYFRKQIEERNRMRERTKEISEMMNKGVKYIDKIHECNEIIADKGISETLARMEEVVTMIFHEVDVNPTQYNKLGMFLNYYLPTTEKLLETYIDLDDKQGDSIRVEKMKKEIELALVNICASFEGLLDQFYQDQEMDVVSDISALETLMAQEGLMNGGQAE